MWCKLTKNDSLPFYWKDDFHLFNYVTTKDDIK